MAGRRLLGLLTAALAAAAVAWALTGLPGAPAPCLPSDCDCEAPAPGPIRQPANAWSSLALTAAGLLLTVVSPGGAGGDAPAGRRGGRPPATRPGEARGRALTRDIAIGALAAAGLSAFLYHSGLTAWGARLDGIAVAVLGGALILHASARFHALRLAHTVGRERPPGGPRPLRRGRALLPVLAPWPLLALGGLSWWLGGSGGPWCRPDTLLQAHAAWHLLAAAGIGLWLGGARGADGARPQLPRASSLMPRPTDP